jgi:hypothetical protein
MTRFRDELKLVPRAAWIIATSVCLLVAFVLFGLLISSDGPRGLLPAIIVVPLFIMFFFWILLIGYIAADARRRGMRPVLWVLLAIFVPNMIGFILYFILRTPILRGCPRCGRASNESFAFCTTCGAPLSQACPSCQSAVEPGWGHCPKCGTALAATPGASLA